MAKDKFGKFISKRRERKVEKRTETFLVICKKPVHKYAQLLMETTETIIEEV